MYPILYLFNLIKNNFETKNELVDTIVEANKGSVGLQVGLQSLRTKQPCDCIHVRYIHISLFKLL